MPNEETSLVRRGDEWTIEFMVGHPVEEITHRNRSF
jgi:hypothetical protein